MTVKRRAARTFTRLTGYQITRAGATGPPDGLPAPARLRFDGHVSLEDLAAARAKGGDRLLERPVFIMSSVRSGSTLLRVLVNSHSQLYSPHELHLRDLRVNPKTKYVRHAMAELDADQSELEYLLWDRVLHRDLMRHGKPTLVNKSPDDAFIWDRIVECWPDARFIYLFRHPAAIVDSWNRARDYWSREETAADVLRYASKIEEARRSRPGVAVRYEDLTEDPERETRRICEYLEVAWEPGMLEYGEAAHGDFRPGLGDWGEQIKSGRVQKARPLQGSGALPASLRHTAAAWGYRGAPSEETASEAV
ncbi:MAG: sulfotransferase family protein [Actinomycetes bacterium]